MKNISKEIFIIALLIMIIVLMIGMLLYDYIPNNKVVPEPIKYVSDSNTSLILKEISVSDGDLTIGNKNNNTNVEPSIIKSYSIGEQELNTAASKKTYTSGKTDPFSSYVEPDKTTEDNLDDDPEGKKSDPDKNNTGNKNNDSTGTFFEKKNSK